MCNAWNHPPGCTCGWGGEGHLGRGVGGWGYSNRVARDFVPPPMNSTWKFHDDFCSPSRCPRCGEQVYFIRHNGGSVWVDDLGWPWPKHACFDSSEEPSWFCYFHKHVQTTQSSKLRTGMITQAIWLPKSKSKPCRIILAMDIGIDERVYLATSGTNTADYLLGRLAIVDMKNRVLITSNQEERPILDVEVTPGEFG